MVGTAVREDERGVSTASELLALEEDIGRASSRHANYAFRVALYAEDMEDQIPAVVVWRFKKSIFLRLTNREPRFKVDRGFYADMNTACTSTPRPYYGLNVVRFLAAKLHAETSTIEVKADNTIMPAAAKCYDVSYRAHYEEGGRVKAAFDITVIVHADGSGGLMQLCTASMRFKGQSQPIGQRNLKHLALQSPSEQATLMFTPQLFRNVSLPNIGFGFRSWQKKLGKAVWISLGQLSDKDWIQFQRVRQHFVREYRHKLENVRKFYEQTQSYDA